MTKKHKSLFQIIGKASLCKNCPKCGAELKHKNVIQRFPNWCYCQKCKEIVPIKLVKKKKEANTQNSNKARKE